MQKKILTTIGVIIIIVAGLLFVRERFGINLNPLTYVSNKTINKQEEQTMTIESMGSYRQIPQTYNQKEAVEVDVNIKNSSKIVLSDTYTFKAYQVMGVWDTLKREIKYQDRKNAATINSDTELINESDLLEMIKEIECKAGNDNCYDNINTNDLNNKYGGVEVKFEEPKYEIKFDTTVAPGENVSQKIAFEPDDCGYYMLVVGNKKYWSSSDSGVNRVGFIAVSSCAKSGQNGQIASGVSDIRQPAIDTATPAITKPQVEELPQAGATSWIIAILLIIGGLTIQRVTKRAKIG